MDYPRAKFGDCTFSRFGFIVRTDRQTQRHTDADDRLTHATEVGVSNQQLNSNNCNILHAAIMRMKILS